MTRVQSFLFALLLLLSTVFPVILNKYTPTELLSDPDFSEGFTVLTISGAEKNALTPEGARPQWRIAQWNSKSCLWENRMESNPLTITDGIKMVQINPKNRSALLSIDASKEYGGEPAGLDNWPHLLLEQSPFAVTDDNRGSYSCENRIIFSADVRLADYVPTTNPEGVNAAQFLTYFYMSGKNGNKFIWFGLNLFDDRGLMDTSWSRDFADGAHNMIYTLSTKETYGGKLRTLNRKGVSDEFTHVYVDLTPHIQDCIRKANADNTFGEKVSAEDFYFSGMNIGFEMHGNIRCAVEVKNLSLKSYVRR